MIRVSFWCEDIFTLYFSHYVLLTVLLLTIFVNKQLQAQFFFMYVYFYSLHVSGSYVSIIRRINCINMTSGLFSEWHIPHTCFQSDIYQILGFRVTYQILCFQNDIYQILFSEWHTRYLFSEWHIPDTCFQSDIPDRVTYQILVSIVTYTTYLFSEWHIPDTCFQSDIFQILVFRVTYSRYFQSDIPDRVTYTRYLFPDWHIPHTCFQSDIYQLLGFRVTYTRCRIDTTNSPDVGHVAAWNM